MTMLVRGGAVTGSALPAGATTGQVLQWNGTAWVAATPSASGTTPNATPTAPGLVQLAGDLGGTATAPTVAKIGGATPAAVATTGAYTDLTGRPALAPVATSGAYTDLTGRPALATVATSGSYGDLTGRPLLATVATTGAYGDLTGTPTVPTQYLRVKAAGTSRASTTTQALDPDLQVTSLPVGTYLLQLIFNGDGAGGGGLAFSLGGTAAVTMNAGTFISNGSAGTWASPLAPLAGVPTNANQIPTSATVVFSVTTAGSFGMQWAQTTSSAGASTLRASSALVLTKLA